jgi:hypothetical protein
LVVMTEKDGLVSEFGAGRGDSIIHAVVGKCQVILERTAFLRIYGWQRGFAGSGSRFRLSDLMCQNAHFVTAFSPALNCFKRDGDVESKPRAAADSLRSEFRIAQPAGMLLPYSTRCGALGFGIKISMPMLSAAKDCNTFPPS